MIPDNGSMDALMRSPQSFWYDRNNISGPGSPFLNGFNSNNFLHQREDIQLAPFANQDEFRNMYNDNISAPKLTAFFGAEREKDEQRSVHNPPSFLRDNSVVNSPILPNITPPLPRHAFNAQTNSDEDVQVVLGEEIGAKANGKRKFNKGLKLLSVIVKDIVVEKKETTYKEVADIILRDTIKFENLNLNHKIEIAKEEQNIKRRVYDALNVLISAGILIKAGKMVRKNKNNKEIIVNLKRLDVQTLSSKIVK